MVTRSQSVYDLASKGVHPTLTEGGTVGIYNLLFLRVRTICNPKKKYILGSPGSIDPIMLYLYHTRTFKVFPYRAQHLEFQYLRKMFSYQPRELKLSEKICYYLSTWIMGFFFKLVLDEIAHWISKTWYVLQWAGLTFKTFKNTKMHIRKCKRKLNVLVLLPSAGMNSVFMVQVLEGRYYLVLFW